MAPSAGNLACPRPLTRKAARTLPVSRLFNAYVMVLWSAAAAPKTGKDSIWIGVFKRDVRFRLAFEAHNPATRADAVKMLDAIFAELRRKGERTLVGLDFPFGLPRGAVAAAKLKPADWSGLWQNPEGTLFLRGVMSSNAERFLLWVMTLEPKL